MTKILKVEFKKAFFSYPLVIALFLGILIAFYGTTPSIYTFYDSTDVIDLFTKASGDSSNSIYVLLSFIIVQIPFSTSYVIERNSGYLRYMVPRVNLKKYIFSKFITNFITGGFLLSMVLLIVFGILNIFFPFCRDFQLYISNATFKGPFESLFLQSPVLYCFLIIGLNFLFGGTYASLGLAISSITNNKYITIAAPFMFFIVYSIGLEFLNMQFLLPQTCIIPSYIQGATAFTIFGQMIIITLASFITFFICVPKRGGLYV